MKPIAEGYFSWYQEPRRATIEAEMTMVDTRDDVLASFYVRKLHPRYRYRPVRQLWGRACAVSKAGTVHVCECRWTKEEIVAWKAKARDLAKLLQSKVSPEL